MPPAVGTNERELLCLCGDCAAGQDTAEAHRHAGVVTAYAGGRDVDQR